MPNQNVLDIDSEQLPDRRCSLSIATQTPLLLEVGRHTHSLHGFPETLLTSNGTIWRSWHFHSCLTSSGRWERTVQKSATYVLRQTASLLLICFRHLPLGMLFLASTRPLALCQAENS